MAVRKTAKRTSRRRRMRVVDSALVAELQTKLDEATSVMSQLNGALRYEQRRIAAQRRGEFYSSVGRGAKTAVVATSKAVVAVNKAMGGAIVDAGKTVVKSATWLFTKKVGAEAATAKA